MPCILLHIWMLFPFIITNYMNKCPGGTSITKLQKIKCALGTYHKKEEESTSPAFDQLLVTCKLTFLAYCFLPPLGELPVLENTSAILSHKKESHLIISSWISVHDPGLD